MEGSKETKFVCNFCNKSYSCGKSLGGHIRIHKNEKSARVAVKEKDRTNIVKLQVSKDRRRSKKDSESEVADGNSGYGLRENPKMTQRFADSRFTSTQDKFCRECGKGFQSSEAVCGHLAGRSGNEGGEKKEDHFGITHQNQGLVDDRSDSAESLTSTERVHLAATCLMMMSRDTRFSGFGGLNSVAESSDNKPSSRHLRESVTSATGRKLEVAECGTEDSDTENFRKEACKKVKLKVSVDGSTMDKEHKKHQVKCGIRIGSSSAESLKNSMKNEKNDHVHTPYKYELRKRSNNYSYSPDLLEGSNKKMSNGCSIHSEIVHSPHTESHKKMLDGCESTHQSGENSINTALNSISTPARELIESSRGRNKSNQDISGSEEKKLGPKRRHKCPICFKVFKSGQALGGHKRSHMVGNFEDTSMVMKQETSGVTGLFDLNAPAPMEDEEDGRWDSFH